MEGGKLAFASPSSLKPIPEEFPAGLRVLVVDDDPICLKIIEKMLTTCKYKGKDGEINYLFFFFFLSFY